MIGYFQKIFDYKTYLVTVFAVITFSNFMVVLFGHTIPGIFLTFFKMAGEYVILGSVFVFCTNLASQSKTSQSSKTIFSCSV